MAAWELAILEAPSQPFSAIRRETRARTVNVHFAPARGIKMDVHPVRAASGPTGSRRGSSLGPMLRTPRGLWLAAGVCVVSFLVLLAVVYGTEGGAVADRRALEGFGGLQRPRVAELSDAIARAANPKPFALITVLIVAFGFLRRLPLHALAAGSVLFGANVTTQLLKPLLANPRGTFGEYRIAAEAFPSGHATAAMTVALAALIVAPPRLRPLAAVLGAGFALAVGFSIVSLDWHFPSDVAGGYLVAAAWCFGVLALLRTLDRRRGVGRRGRDGSGAAQEAPAWWPAAAALLVALVIVAWLAIERLPRLTGYAQGHTTFAVVAAATAALAFALVGAVLAATARR